MTELARLKFYATQAHSCSYLPDEQATTLFLDPSQPMDVNVYADLSEMGFRRSGDHLYRPHCQNCNACVPARIPAARFIPNRQQRRILKRNADLTVTAARPAFKEEYFDLYRRYIEIRHADGDMYPPSRDQFSTFLVRDLPFCWFYEFRLAGRLLAVAVCDLLPNGLSAVYKPLGTLMLPREITARRGTRIEMRIGRPHHVPATAPPKPSLSAKASAVCGEIRPNPARPTRRGGGLGWC